MPAYLHTVYEKKHYLGKLIYFSTYPPHPPIVTPIVSRGCFQAQNQRAKRKDV